MAELMIRPEEITEALRKHVESFEPSVTREEIGRVTQVGEGVAIVEGLPSTMANELLEFESGAQGIAFNLDVREIGCVILGDARGDRGGSGGPPDGRRSCRCPSATASSAA